MISEGVEMCGSTTASGWSVIQFAAAPLVGAREGLSQPQVIHFPGLPEEGLSLATRSLHASCNTLYLAHGRAGPLCCLSRSRLPLPPRLPRFVHFSALFSQLVRHHPLSHAKLLGLSFSLSVVPVPLDLTMGVGECLNLGFQRISPGFLHGGKVGPAKSREPTRIGYKYNRSFLRFFASQR